MPPRGPGYVRGGARGAARGGGPARAGAITVGLPDASSHITTIGVKRPAFGSSGRSLTVFTNHFVVSIPDANIHHYDGTSPLRPLCDR